MGGGGTQGEGNGRKHAAEQRERGGEGGSERMGERRVQRPKNKDLSPFSHRHKRCERFCAHQLCGS